MARLRRRHRIRNFHGFPIPCCWTDCWAKASTDHEVVVPHDAPRNPGDTLTYAFCSEAHKILWLSANIPGQLGKNLSGRRSPLGLILP